MTDRPIPNAAMLSGWRKSSHSNTDAGSCLEVLDGHRLGVPVRDSKNPHGPALVFPLSAWRPFVSEIKDGGSPS